MKCAKYKNSTEFSLNPLDSIKCVTLYGNNRSPFRVSFPKGTYKVELWGAAGGSSPDGSGNYHKGGFGGYSSGILTLLNTETFIFEVGTKGEDVHLQPAQKPSNGILPGKGGYNGGADGAIDDHNQDCPSAGSGGSTDMRINGTVEGRIIVAGGGGSSGCYTNGGEGGHGGGLKGTNGQNNTAGYAVGGLPGTQDTGYQLLNGEPGSPGGEAGGSGGGGYWGGLNGESTYIGYYQTVGGGSGGGGGSSYISGHDGCKIIDGYRFTNTEMITGNNPMPSIDDYNGKSTGNSGNGAVRITCLFYIQTCQQYNVYLNIKPFVFIFLMNKQETS